MIKNMIRFLLSNFQATDVREDSVGCLRIHVLVWLVYFLVLESALISILVFVYVLTIVNCLCFILPIF